MNFLSTIATMFATSSTPAKRAAISRKEAFPRCAHWSRPLKDVPSQGAPNPLWSKEMQGDMRYCDIVGLAPGARTYTDIVAAQDDDD